MSDILIWDKKTAESEYRLEFLFDTYLAPGDAVLEAHVAVRNGEVIADRFDSTENALRFWVRGGKPGIVARLDMVAKTVNGETLSVITKMAVE